MRAIVLAIASFVALAALALTAQATPDTRTQTLVSTGSIGGNADFDATWGGASTDGTHVFFSTQEPLVAADTDTSYDVYERFNNATTLVSTGSINGNGAFNATWGGVSSDGLHVYFQTAEKLVSADTDNVIDVYERFNGTTSLVSTGSGNFNTANDSFFLGVSTDGTKAFVSSYDQLAATDTDGSFRDVYMRSGGSTTQISIGGNGPYGADFDGMTPDGSHVYYHTDEKLSGADTDATRDLYDASGGSVSLVSTGPNGGNSGTIAIFQGATPDGSHVYFQTAESLVAGDTDSSLDVYDRSGGTTTQISVGPTGGNGTWDATFGGAASDGSKVWFDTREPLVAGDTDANCEDQNGNFTIPCRDVYERTGSTTNWISTGGSGSYDASFAAASQDGSKVFFHSTEPLTADDTDSNQDIFQRSGGVTTRMSGGPDGGNGLHDATLSSISKDGTRVFFLTYESLVSEDNDGNWQDVYERYENDTTLISTGPAASNQAAIAFFDGSTDGGTRLFFHTDEKLVTTDTDLAEDIYSSVSTNPGYPRAKGASPLRFAFVPAYEECVNSNSTHGASLSYPSCNPPVPLSQVLTVGTPDANGQPANSTASMKLKAKPGVPGPPDDSDVLATVSISDVRCRQTNAACPNGPLSDYTGKVLIHMTVRLTDKYNGSPPVEASTVQDIPVDIPVQCNATGTTDGALCSGTISLAALYPGLILDTKRATWQVESVEVRDPGPNGTGYGAGCPSSCGDGDETVFMKPGIFIP